MQLQPTSLSGKPKFLTYCPAPRTGFGATVRGDEAFFYGGTSGKDHQFLWNDLHSFSRVTLSWNCIEHCYGVTPEPSYGNSIEYVPSEENEKGKLFLFGGKGKNSFVKCSFLLDLDSWEWTAIPYHPGQPSKRYYHSATYIGDQKVLIFGGRDKSVTYNDVHVFDFKDMSWTKLKAAGYKPKARYHHSAFYIAEKNQFMIYGGITKMSSINDLWILDLDIMKWSLVKIPKPPSLTHRVLGHAILINWKLYVFDWSTEPNWITCYTIENNYRGTSELVETTGDVLTQSLNYRVVKFNNDVPSNAFVDLSRSCCITFAKEDTEGQLKLTTITVRPREIEYLPEFSRTGETITASIHYSTQIPLDTSINITTTLLEAKKIVAEQFEIPLPQVAFFIQYQEVKGFKEKYLEKKEPSQNYCHYLCIETQDQFENFLAKRAQSPCFAALHLYIAHSDPAVSEKKREVIDIFSEELASGQLLGNAPSRMVMKDDLTLHVPQKTVVVNKVTSEVDSSDSEEITLVSHTNFPLLFSASKQKSFIRWIHQKARDLENWGLYDGDYFLLKEDSGQFNIGTFFLVLFCLLCIPLLFLYFFFNAVIYKRHCPKPYWLLFFFVVFIVNVYTFLIPITGMLLHGPDRALLFTPFFAYFILCFAIAMVGGYRGAAVGTKCSDLAAYPVKIYQRLAITKQYGLRNGTAEEIMFVILDKEDLRRDNPFFSILSFSISFLFAILQVVISIVVLWSQDKLPITESWQRMFIFYSTIGLNLVTNYALLFVLALSILVYVRLLTHLKLFNCVLSKHLAIYESLPVLSLDKVENILAWTKMRDYLMQHEFLPIDTSNTILCVSLVVNASLWIFIAVQVFTYHDTLYTAHFLSIVYSALVLTMYIGLGFFLQMKILHHREEHLEILVKAKIKLTLKLQIKVAHTTQLKTKAKQERKSESANIKRKLISTGRKRKVKSLSKKAVREDRDAGKKIDQRCESYLAFFDDQDSLKALGKKASLSKQRVKELKACRQLLDDLRKIIKKQESNKLRLFGIPLPLGVIKIIFGLPFPLIIAIATKAVRSASPSLSN